MGCTECGSAEPQASPGSHKSLSRTRSSRGHSRWRRGWPRPGYAPLPGQPPAKQGRLPTSETRFLRGRVRYGPDCLSQTTPFVGPTPGSADPLEVAGLGALSSLREKGAPSRVKSGLRSQISGCNTFIAPPQFLRNCVRWTLCHPFCTRGIRGSEERATDLPKTTKSVGPGLRSATECKKDLENLRKQPDRR